MAISFRAVVVCAALVALAAAYPTYQQAIPNGDKITRNGEAAFGAGHVNPAGGGEVLNDFGTDFLQAGSKWSINLCENDVDGDGFTNGQELGDPDCTWTPGAKPSRTTGISHPGYADSTPSTEGEL
jgi:dopamine beta-monooxygenase